MELDLLLKETGALLSGHYRLSSGLHSPSYIQCARLLEHPANAKAIGAALAGRLGKLVPQKIVAPALGGVVIGYAVAEALDIPMVFTERKDGAMTLRRGFAIGDQTRVVIVEDVVTTGRSTRETAEAVIAHGADVVGYASILNRSGVENPFNRPYYPLMSIALETYPPETCPLCARGIPLDAPGSRYS